MLLCLTANHRNAAFDLLDRLSTAAPSATAELVAEAEAVQGAVVIATCNRFEAYLDLDDRSADPASAVDRTIEVMSAAGGVDADELRAAVSVVRDPEVPQHLFAVASGLESVVVGEDEIAGQVRRAFDAAKRDGTSSRELDRLFQRAASTSRAVRTATDLGGSGRSLVRLALELASSRITDWAHARVLVVGTGSYAATTIAALRDRGAAHISVYSRTGRAAMFARRYGIHAVDGLPAAIAEADVVITCTARYTVVPEDFANARRRLVIDLGLPRNVDPAVRGIPGVELLDLEIIALHAPLPELSADTARGLVDTAASAYAADREVAPAIVALREHVFDALDAEIARARGRGGDERTVEALRHLAGVILHTPSVRGRELARDGRGEEFTAGLEAVFGIRPAAAPQQLPLPPHGDAADGPAGSVASAS
ncbi:glutamyl-tRNA reductase [Homoserinibacter sp. YIM 151385]|uniref:glutamyl-tRNA reductase n=1 Tax=Homoserinibacter sp. YIM 151385 TaxID=2985506 RepID=UPI0022F11D70|nr:glutamyl-tRNA reductase [Homoserinibacter sp. YIM 151385]WBU37185.1 glutamyl-tRNA reductase [Homoserinibacter sp. YIM 151385]